MLLINLNQYKQHLPASASADWKSKHIAMIDSDVVMKKGFNENEMIHKFPVIFDRTKTNCTSWGITSSVCFMSSVLFTPSFIQKVRN